MSAALMKVADWQLQRSAPHFDDDWTFGVLYTGFMAIPESVAGKRYIEAMRSMGQTLHWQMGPDLLDANDMTIGQTYLALYESYKDPAMMQSVKDRAAFTMRQTESQERPLWWWCDALFMAPAAFAEISRITGDQRYLDYMDTQWSVTSSHLYETRHRLFFRDARFLTRKEANGEPVFWSRGNGWVLAGLAKVLQNMPKDYPSRPKYVAQFQEMAASLAKLQRPNGLWTAGLLDPTSYPADETSGTGLITFGLAYGINSGILSKEEYEPHVALAWRGLVSHIFVDGRLGSVQKVADAPGHLKPTSSYVYGVGAFLLAGSEIYSMAQQ
ncbi:glycoside hydrolase family 105 protein [Terriglobus sp. YAF25]|uniref:glycoside hydrolase family 88/105 protein n=1 Tax=Terriglobus sp. YAF25 TaxID=3233080 RepID=UPI003F9C7C9C